MCQGRIVRQAQILAKPDKGCGGLGLGVQWRAFKNRGVGCASDKQAISGNTDELKKSFAEVELGHTLTECFR